MSQTGSVRVSSFIHFLLAFGSFPSAEPRTYVLRPYHPVSAILHISRILCRRSRLQRTLRFLHHVFGRQPLSLFLFYGHSLDTSLPSELFYVGYLSPIQGPSLLYYFYLHSLSFFYLTQFCLASHAKPSPFCTSSDCNKSSTTAYRTG